MSQHLSSMAKDVSESLSGMPDASALPERRRGLTFRTVVICASIFAVALGVRLLHWQDNRQSFPFEGMTGEYKYHAMLLVKGNLTAFWQGHDPPSDANTIKHPPGYPFFMAAVYKLSGDSDAALRFVHIVCDSLSAVLVFVIAAELFPLAVACLAGLLVALSPQLAYHSIMLLPDPLATLPLLVAVYLLIRASRRPRLLTVVAAGVSVGVSCWLRSNAMLLPFFLACLVPLLFERGRRLRYAAALVGATLACIAPVTIHNAIVFRRFIPLSISAGITLVEGIGIYDEEKRFGLPSSDYEVTKWEAEEFKRPDYLGSRFHPDGIEREQHRISRALAVIRANPFWFLRVMAHRGFSMLRLARVELIAAQPAVTNSLDVHWQTRPAHALSPSELKENGLAPTERTKLSLADDEGEPDACGATLRVESDEAASLFVSQPMRVEKNTDYLLRIPARIRTGSLRVDVVDAQHEDTILASTPILHPVNWLGLTPDKQPLLKIERPFVSGGAEEVRVVLRNGNGGNVRVVAEAGQTEVFTLGAASYTWTRYPRLLLRGVQRVFLTAFMLPLAILGAVWMWRAGARRYLALLVVVPVYYMCVQSALWSEFRYVLAMYYFLLMLSAAGLYRAWTTLRQTVWKTRRDAA